MRNVVFAINMTADGYCSHTDMIADEELHDFFTSLLRLGDTILYGRITYELMVPFWPDVAKSQSEDPATNEFARVFDSLEKVVFSKTLKSVEDGNSRLAQADIAEELFKLKQRSGKDIYIGSLNVASQAIRLGMVDEYYFAVHPVIAGKGPRLFEALDPKEMLRINLVETKTLPSGVVILHYKRGSQ